MEYIALGDLHQYMESNPGAMPENEARAIAEQLLFGLEMMHAGSFGHYDLKPGVRMFCIFIPSFNTICRMSLSSVLSQNGG